MQLASTANRVARPAAPIPSVYEMSLLIVSADTEPKC